MALLKQADRVFEENFEHGVHVGSRSRSIYRRGTRIVQLQTSLSRREVSSGPCHPTFRIWTAYHDAGRLKEALVNAGELFGGDLLGAQACLWPRIHHVVSVDLRQVVPDGLALVAKAPEALGRAVRAPPRPNPPWAADGKPRASHRTAGAHLRTRRSAPSGTRNRAGPDAPPGAKPPLSEPETQRAAAPDAPSGPVSEK